MKYINKYSKYLILIIIIIISYYFYINLYKTKKCLIFFTSNNMKKEYNKYNINYRYIDNDFEISKNNKSYKLCEINLDESKSLSNDKYKTNIALSKNNINVCNYCLWNNNKNDEENFKNINNKLKFPVVIKYIYGQKGEDVFTNIYTNKEIIDKIQYLKNKNKNYIIIEQQEFGDKYRIFVSFDKIIYIQKHNIPQIIGNGKTSIYDLIKEYPSPELQKQNDIKVYPIKNIDKNLIKSQGYNLHDILEKNKKLYATSVINYHNGSIIEDIDINTVHQSNITMFKHINNVVKLNISGIDFITNDISIPNNGKVIEVNAGPGYNVVKHKDIINKKLIDSLFK
jgi:D-alanine-D-alanine ligase-like ATP-grasp enzyme